MTRGNPSVERAASVLALLSADPGRGFTLAEIVRQTELSKATCHALLASLTSSRWLLRYPTGPSYRLGPGLIALGEAARQGYPELPYAQDKMRELGTELGLECMASAVVGSEIVILAKSGVPAPLSATAAIGQRIPLVPPLATVFFAWSQEATIEAAFSPWTTPTAGPSHLTDSYRRGLRAVHDRGYAMGLENPVRERLGRTLTAQLARGQVATPEAARLVGDLSDEDYQLIELDPGATYWLSYLAAPIFDANGRVTLALTLVGFPSSLQGDEVHRHGKLLRAAADEVTAAVHGRAPAGSRGFAAEEAVR
ncbi:MAG TPA: helix-turn-helix domain-containing protein [Frankiaceae bacterium]|nr:helix-turn-helix domain-containing protein [Frankiaceae bacterium]